MKDLRSSHIKTRKMLQKAQTKKVVKDFCESTSLHGYSYLYIVDSLGLKLVWILVILCTTGLGIYFFVKNTEDYIKARIVTNIESSSADLNVCNLRLFHFSKFLPSATLYQSIFTGCCISISHCV